MDNFECKPVMANLQAGQLGIHGEDSWWQLFDLIIIQVPAKKVYPESNDYYALVSPIFPDLFSVNKKIIITEG